MNIGITISYIVGGILLISILTLNNTVMHHSYQQTIGVTTGSQVDEIRRLIMHDMQFLAFGPNSDLLNFSENHIRFRAQIDGSNRVISWQMPGNSYNGTSNPNDKVLRRQGPLDGSPGNTMTTYPVVRFHVEAFSDKEGEIPTTIKQEVRSILIEVVVESPEAVGSHSDGSPRFRSSGWRKLFIPDNMMI